MYTEKVMDHFQHPRNMGEIENASGHLKRRAIRDHIGQADDGVGNGRTATEIEYSFGEADHVERLCQRLAGVSRDEGFVGAQVASEAVGGRTGSPTQGGPGSVSRAVRVSIEIRRFA